MRFLKFRRIIFLSLFTLSQISSHSQYSTWMDFSSGKHINCLADEGGFVWVGTLNGLVKVDKLTGTISWFDKCNSPLPANNIQSIAIDRQGTKWISVMDHGLMKFDNTSWTFYDTAYCGVSLHYISVVRVDTAGNRWLGTINGLVRFSATNTWSVYDTLNSGISGNWVHTLWIDGQDTKWISTDKGLSRFSGYTWTTYTPANSGLPSVVNDITVDDNNVKWFATGAGLARFNDVSWTVYNSSNSGLTTNNISCVCHDNNGNIWVGGPLHCKSATEGGLFKFDQQNWTYYNHSNSGLPTDYLTTIMADNAGMKWVGTYFGLTSFNGTTWTSYATGNSGLPDDRVSCIAITPDGNKWIGCGSNDWTGYYNPGVTTTDNFNWTTFTSSNSGVNGDVKDIETDSSGKVYISYEYSPSPGITCFNGTDWMNLFDPVHNFPWDDPVLEKDSSGVLWVGSNGLGRFDGTNWTVFNRTNSQIPADYISSIAFGKNGVIWFAGQTRNGYIGLGKYDGTSWTTFNTSNSPIPDDEVRAIAVDHAGNVWVGTGLKIAKFDGINWTVYDHGFFIILKIYIDQNDHKWIGDYGGLYRFDNGNFIAYNPANSGLPDSRVPDMIMDELGNLWCCTINGGVGVYNPDGVVLKANSFLAIEKTRLANFPNPFSHVTTIRVPEPFDKEKIILELFDLSGKRILQESYHNKTEIRIFRNCLNQGIYFFRLSSATETVIGNGKVVVTD
ncbi:MAG TPA: two-component regulator propeller domain-containing protein [Bacteroidales bacterium]|nr:two-component regulator propeller domain-containing protein [Bacteroidales bacterium]